MNKPLIGIAPKLVTTKVRVAAGQIGMIATIIPAEIIGSEKSDMLGMITLVVQGYGLPEGEFCALHYESGGGVSTCKLIAAN